MRFVLQGATCFVLLALIAAPRRALAQELPGGGPPPGAGPAPVPMLPSNPPPGAPGGPPPSTGTEPNGQAAAPTFTGASESRQPALDVPSPFLGATVVGGAAWAVITGSFSGNDSSPEGMFLFALRGGVLFDKEEIALEISPFTYQYYKGVPGPTFQFTATYGHLFPIYEDKSVTVSWPLRVGVGMFTGNTQDLFYFQARADLLGLNIRYGHVLFDLYFPSFRYAVTATQGAALHIFSWPAGVSAAYAF